MTDTRPCNTCKIEKPECDFPQFKGKSIKFNRYRQHGQCKTCNAHKAREWRKKNPGYSGTGRVAALPMEERTWMSAVRTRLSGARERCKKLKRNPPILTDQYLYELLLAQGKECALTGVKLTLEINHPLCLSLDQIDPEKGYVEGNVQWLAWCVNRAKGDLTTSNFHSMCEAVIKHRKVQRLSP